MLVAKDVFPPDKGTVNELFESYINSQTFADKSVLDMGCGCGNLGLLAWTRRAKRIVLADNHRPAFNCAFDNVVHNVPGNPQ